MQKIFSINTSHSKYIKFCLFKHNFKFIRYRYIKNQKRALRNIDALRNKLAQNNIILFFDHSLGGGTETYFYNELKSIIKNSDVIRIQYLIENKYYALTYINKENTETIKYLNWKDIQEFLSKIELKQIIINNLVGYPTVKSIFDFIKEYKTMKKETFVTVMGHDFYPICPCFNLLDNNNNFCAADCNNQKSANCYPNIILKSRDIKHKEFIENWQELWNNFITHNVDELRVFSPSSKNIFLKTYPNIEEKITLIPHKIKPFPKYNIAIVGNLLPHKGFDIIKNIINYLEKNDIHDFHFYIIGDCSGELNREFVTQLGNYNRNSLPNILKNNNISMIFIPSIWAETFSYTTAESIALGYPTASFNLGGQADQIKVYNKGLILSSFEPDTIIQEFYDFLKSTF